MKTLKTTLGIIFGIIGVFLCIMSLDGVTYSLTGRSFGLIVIVVSIILCSIVVYISNNRVLSRETMGKMAFIPVNTPIPGQLKSYHKAILELGFELAVEGHIPGPGFLFSGHRIVWLYLSPDQTIVVWLHNEPRVDFDTIFADGFSVSTMHPHGIGIQDDKHEFEIVTTSVSAAFDYHHHHCHLTAVEHGEPIAITDWQIIKDHEVQSVDTYRQRANQQFKSGAWTFIWQVAVLFGLGFVSNLYVDYVLNIVNGNETLHPILVILIAISGLIVAVSPIVWLIWIVGRAIHHAVRPPYAVEARKAKKNTA